MNLGTLELGDICAFNRVLPRACREELGAALGAGNARGDAAVSLQRVIFTTNQFGSHQAVQIQLEMPGSLDLGFLPPLFHLDLSNHSKIFIECL